jgi:hypothetical protein
MGCFRWRRQKHHRFVRELIPVQSEPGSIQIVQFNPLNPGIQLETNVSRLQNFRLVNSRCIIYVSKSGIMVSTYSYDVYLQGGSVECQTSSLNFKI